MIRRPPRSTRTDTLFPYTTLFRSVLFPVVGRYVEQAGVLAVGHGVPVLAAEEGWGYFNRFAVLLARLRFGWALTLVLHWSTGFQIDMAGPGDAVDEGEGVLQLAVLAVDDIEEAVAVGVGRGLDGLAVLVLVIRLEELRIGRGGVSTCRS